MKRSLIAVAAVVVGLVGAITLEAVEERIAVDEMADAAEELLASLSDDLRGEATFDFESDQRERFHFIPPETYEREGAWLKAMTEEQREQVHDLLRTGLSQRGYMTTRQIIEVEGILAVLEGPERQFRRDARDYWISVFGTPSDDGTWGWKFEGHHVSLHFTVVDGEMTVSTPTFLGANPAEVPEGHPRAGLRPMRDQEDTARRLLASLDGDQREQVLIDDVAPQNIVSAMTPAIEPFEPAGIRASELSSRQKELLMDVVEAWAGVMDDDIAELRLEKVREGGIDDLTFAWAGGTERGEVGYYRVQGPTFLIEFDFTQENPNHIHGTWRDFEGDLGRDLLREHLERDH